MYLKGLWISIQIEISIVIAAIEVIKLKNLAKLQHIQYPCNLLGGHLIITAKNIGLLRGIFWKSQSAYFENIWYRQIMQFWGGYILPYTLFRFKTTLTILIILEVLQKNNFKAKSLITLLVFMHACFCLDNVLFNEVYPCGLMQLKQLNWFDINYVRSNHHIQNQKLCYE